MDQQSFTNHVYDLSLNRNNKIKYMLHLVHEKKTYSVGIESTEDFNKYFQDDKFKDLIQESKLFTSIVFEKIKYRFASTYLINFIKENGFYYFCPCKMPTFDVSTDDDGNNIIEVCFYHDSKLHEIIFSKFDEGLVMAPLVDRDQMELLFLENCIDPPFKMKHYSNNSGDILIHERGPEISLNK